MREVCTARGNVERAIGRILRGGVRGGRKPDGIRPALAAGLIDEICQSGAVRGNRAATSANPDEKYCDCGRMLCLRVDDQWDAELKEASRGKAASPFWHAASPFTQLAFEDRDLTHGEIGGAADWTLGRCRAAARIPGARAPVRSRGFDCADETPVLAHNCALL